MENLTVYVVYYYCLEPEERGGCVCGVFSTKEAAEKHIEAKEEIASSYSKYPYVEYGYCRQILDSPS